MGSLKTAVREAQRALIGEVKKKHDGGLAAGEISRQESSGPEWGGGVGNGCVRG